jgi:hypothetical protein
VYSVGIEDEFDMKYKALKKINYKYWVLFVFFGAQPKTPTKNRGNAAC